MKRKIIPVLGLLAIPLGALLINACGPQGDMNNDGLELESASDQFRSNAPMYYNNLTQLSEYGLCDDTVDNNGDGLVDMADPDCHYIGPLRDLSLYNFPVGHNFAPDITMTPPGGPGFAGGFRDREQITKWLRFLTEPDGFLGVIDIYSPGVNPGVVPVPAPLADKIEQGTFAQGNNNNVNPTWLAIGANPPVPASIAPITGTAGAQFLPAQYGEPVSRWGEWPGEFYRAQGPGAWGPAIGSQGALERTGTR